MLLRSKSTGGFLVSASALAIAGLVGSGCGGGSAGDSSSSKSSTGVGGQSGASSSTADGGGITYHRTGDSGTGVASIDSSSGSDGTGAASTYDGTVGNACTSDVDCQPAGGPGIDTCSITTFRDPIFPQAVCVQSSCNPGTDGAVHFCDGPDEPSSPGVCVQTSPGVGLCLPECLIPSDGTAPSGCQGLDACVLYSIGTEANSNTVIGLGYCFGGCTKDTDCPTGNVCQTNEGICVSTATAPTKALGAACTSADNGTSTTPANCNCLFDSTTSVGICSQFCLVGSTAAACPAGYVCDSSEPTMVLDDADAAIPGFAMQNTGLSGYCLPMCTAAGTGCPTTPTGLTCINADTAGPDCQP